MAAFEAPSPAAGQPSPAQPPFEQPAFEQPSFAGQAPRASAPHEDDVRVAGTARAAAPGGDTLGFDSAEPLSPAGRARAGRSAGHGGGSGGRTGLRIAAVAAGAAVVIGGGAVAALAFTGGSGDSGDGAATVQPTRQLADAAPPKVDPKVLEQQRRELALERASRKTREDDGKGPALRPKGAPIPTKTPEKKKDGAGGGGGGPVGDPVPKGEAQEIAKKLMPSFGFTGDGQFGCLVNLWERESGWNTHAANPSSGAYGIPQALPGSKMGSAGPDWQNNATTQIKWGLGYIKDRYKTPCGGWSHFQSVGWY
ncbi:aggregation-promoting factor C-terminal-like domain-containing protein [Actinomadura geliboluensis]